MEHKIAINARIICSIGAVFDFYAGTVSRPGKLWIDFHMEWLGRLIREPKRMWKRYLYFGPIYIYYIMQRKLSLRQQVQSKRSIAKKIIKGGF